MVEIGTREQRMKVRDSLRSNQQTGSSKGKKNQNIVMVEI